MSQWGNRDQASDAPKYTTDASTGKTGIEEYGDAVTAATTTTTVPGAASPGWIRTVKGKGTVTGARVISGGTGYVDSDTIEIGDESGTLITTAGAITGVDIFYSGDLTDEVPVVVITSADGTGGVVEAVTSGKIGRKSIETLVAMRGIQ